MNVQREARQDAKEFARAQMFYGEGAGTRRKLITATVEGKQAKDPVYAENFRKALGKQDMSEHATKARHERERRDAGTALSKNARGLATGNYQAVNTGVLVALSALVIAHKTGYDKKIIAKAKKTYLGVKHRYIARKVFRDIPVAEPNRNH